jgi:transposase-like protein
MYRRNKTASEYILYMHYICIPLVCLSLRKTSERLFPFIKRNHMYLLGIGFKSTQAKEDTPKEKESKKEFIIDETLLKVGSSQYAWLWITIELLDKLILGIRISFERTILVAEQFLNSLVNTYGKCNVQQMEEEHGIFICL